VNEVRNINAGGGETLALSRVSRRPFSGCSPLPHDISRNQWTILFFFEMRASGANHFYSIALRAGADSGRIAFGEKTP
jgi:hypothetical protein